MKNNLTTLTLMATLLASPAAFSAGPSHPPENTSGPFIGTGIGFSTKERIDFPSNAPKNARNSGGASNFNIYGGYNLNENLGLKLGYSNFGKADISGGSAPKTTYKAGGVSLSGVGSYYLSPDWALVGEAGVLFYNVKRNSGNISDTASGNKFFVAAGMKYALSKNLDLVGMYTRYGTIEPKFKTAAQNTSNKLNLDNIAVSLQYRF